MAIFEQITLLLLPLFATGILSGFLAGLLGVGGGIVIVPILAFLLEYSGIATDMPMHLAVGSSLAIIVPTSIISARAHYKIGNVDYTVIKQLGPFVFLGALGGAVVAYGGGEGEGVEVCRRWQWRTAANTASHSPSTLVPLACFWGSSPASRNTS